MGGPGKGVVKRSGVQKSSSSYARQTMHKGHTYFPLQDEEDHEEQEHEAVESFSGGLRKGILKMSKLQKSSRKCALQPIQKKRTYFSLQDLEDPQEQEHEKGKSISDGPGKGILKRSRLQKLSSKCDLRPIQKRHTYIPLQDEEDSEEQEHEKVESFSSGPRKGILKRSNLQKSGSSTDGQLVKKRRTYFPLVDDEDQQEQEHEIIESFPTHVSHVRRVLDSNVTKRNQYEEEHQENEHLGDSLQTKTNASDPLHDENTSSNSHGKSVTRKETRALTQTTKRQGKLAFEVDECAGRIVGEDSQVFITKGGCVMRQFAKFDGTTWRKQSPLLKTNIISKCTENSSYDPNSRVMVHAIQTQLASQHRNKQYRLHNYYKTFPTKEEATTHPPNGIKVPDWVNLCERFASEDFKKISTRNKKNNSFNEVPPAVGTVSIARVVDMKRRQGQEVTAIDQYKIAHYSERKHKMVNEKADEIWNELQNEEATSSCTPAEICLKKLHRIPGHIRGRSASTSCH